MEEYLKFVPVVALVVGIVCGGLGGALLTLSVTAYRNRRQPVGSRMHFFELFSKGAELGSLDGFITLTDGTNTEHFDNLYLCRIAIINKGNKDYSEFRFLMSMTKGDRTVSIKSETPDKSHLATIINDVNLVQPATEIDVKLEPFNRAETYFFDILLDVPLEQKYNSEILLSTKEPIRFVKLGVELDLDNFELTLSPIRAVENAIKVIANLR